MSALRAAALLLTLWVAPQARAELYYVIVGGLGGAPEYEEAFAAQVQELANVAERTLGGKERVTVLVGDVATSDALRQGLAGLAERTDEADRLAVFLVGHGSFDGAQYKLNLPGPDIDAAELKALFSAIPARTQLVVNATSASGAVLEDWGVDGRTVITATRSGAERNATRFAEHFAASLSAAAADINKNGMITAREAFDYAERGVAESYESEGTLATEHPQLVGDNAQAFEVARLTARRAERPAVGALTAERAALEERIAALRLRREELGDDYFPQLQALLVELALLEERIDAAEGQ